MLTVLLVAAAIYVLSNPGRGNLFGHFIWQADAFLHGRAWIPWPVFDGPIPNGDLQDFYPLREPGRALIPFPPLPAVLLMPLVWLWGLDTHASLVAALIGGVNVGLAWRVCSRLTDDRRVALLGTWFYGFGTVAWYAAMLGSTWFLAHVVASAFLLLAIGVALDADPAANEASPNRAADDTLQFVAGLLFGTSALARLTTIFGAPFFALVGGGPPWRRAVVAGLGAALPVLLLLGYNVATSGRPFHPGYEYLYRTEVPPVPTGLLVDLVPALRGITYHPGEWGIEDPRYLPQNLLIMLGWLPEVRPGCGLNLVDPGCPLVRPSRLGTSLLLTSPAYLLALAALRDERRRVVVGSVLAVGAIALVNLAHFSQGWVQFGYRFSNDFAPFALVLVTLGIARLGIRPLTVGLVAASIAINAWGVYWGVTLGW